MTGQRSEPATSDSMLLLSLENIGDGVRDLAGRRWGAVVDAAVVNDPEACVRDAEGGGRVICWSAFAGERLFEADPRAWRQEWWTRFAQACAAADRRLAASGKGGRLLIRTHARHVLSDLVRCRKFLSECATERVGVVADVGALFTRSMLRDAQDHAERMAEMIESMPGLSAVVLSNPKDATDIGDAGIDEGEPLLPARLDGGVLPVQVMVRIGSAAERIGAAVIRCV